MAKVNKGVAAGITTESGGVVPGSNTGGPMRVARVTLMQKVLGAVLGTNQVPAELAAQAIDEADFAEKIATVITGKGGNGQAVAKAISKVNQLATPEAITTAEEELVAAGREAVATMPKGNAKKATKQAVQAAVSGGGAEATATTTAAAPTPAPTPPPAPVRISAGLAETIAKADSAGSAMDALTDNLRRETGLLANSSAAAAFKKGAGAYLSARGYDSLRELAEQSPEALNSVYEDLKGFADKVSSEGRNFAKKSGEQILKETGYGTKQTPIGAPAAAEVPPQPANVAATEAPTPKAATPPSTATAPAGPAAAQELSGFEKFTKGAREAASKAGTSIKEGIKGMGGLGRVAGVGLGGLWLMSMLRDLSEGGRMRREGELMPTGEDMALEQVLATTERERMLKMLARYPQLAAMMGRGQGQPQGATVGKLSFGGAADTLPPELAMLLSGAQQPPQMPIGGGY